MKVATVHSLIFTIQANFSTIYRKILDLEAKFIIIKVKNAK
jgi:hypothetical protein